MTVEQMPERQPPYPALQKCLQRLAKQTGSLDAALEKVITDLIRINAPQGLPPILNAYLKEKSRSKK